MKKDKAISLLLEHYDMLAELEPSEAAQISQALSPYIREGIVPKFSSSGLKAIFSFFRSHIDEQLESSARRSEINKNNASRKKTGSKKTSKKSLESSDVADSPSELLSTADEATNPTESSDSQQIADDAAHSCESNELLRLEAIEAVYSKLGTYRDESLSLWSSFSEETKHRAIDYVRTYIQQVPNVADQLYLNRYLKAEPWKK